MRVEYTSDSNEIFSRFNQLRGFFALVVMLSHIWFYSGLSFLLPFNKAVTIAVAMFLFLSGYGLARSDKAGVCFKVAFIKIPHIVFMSIEAYVVSFLGQTLLKLPNDYKLMYRPFGLRSYLSSTNWYVFELIGFFLLFIIIRAFSNKRLNKVLLWWGGGGLTAIVILFFLSPIEATYSSIFGFTTGILLGYYQEYPRLIQAYKKGYVVGIAILTGCFAMMFLLNTTTLLFALIRNIAAVGAAIVLIYFCSYIRIENRINAFVCRISPELYFYHIPTCLIISRIKGIHPIMYLAIVTIVSFGLAIMFNAINGKIHTLWCDRIKHLNR